MHIAGNNKARGRNVLKYSLKLIRGIGSFFPAFLGILTLGFYFLNVFYCESLRNHDYISCDIFFDMSGKENSSLSNRQWREILQLFESNVDQIEDVAFISLSMNDGKKHDSYQQDDIKESLKHLVTSMYFFKGAKNTFSEEVYRNHEAVAGTFQDSPTVEIHSIPFRTMKWDMMSGTEIPITTAVYYHLPIDSIHICCGDLSGERFQHITSSLKKIIKNHQDCDIDSVKQVIALEDGKRTLFFFIVAMAVINMTAIYHYVIKKEKRMAAILRMCGCSDWKLHGIFLGEILLLYGISFAMATLLYCSTYRFLYRWGIVSLRQFPGFHYIGSAGLICGIVLIVLFFVTTWSVIHHTVTDLYAEGSD